MKANKQLFVLLICLLYSLNLKAQLIGIEVYSDSHNQKYTLNQFNDSLAFIRPESTDGFGSYFLGKFKIIGDTIFLEEQINSCLIEQTIALKNCESIHKDSLQIDFFQGDYIIAEGQYTFDSLSFVINGQIYLAKPVTHRLGSYYIRIPHPKNKNINVSIVAPNVLNTSASTKLKRKQNKIEIKEHVVTSMADFVDESFINGVAKFVLMDNQRYFLKISFAY